MLSSSTSVFISYSHRDKEWLERLQVHLKPLVRAGDIKLWDDTCIKPGDQWKLEIESALASARIAVILISPDFLASDFIHHEELPALLLAAEKNGTIILPLILSHSLFEDTELGRFQSVNPLDRPLNGAKKIEQDKTLKELARAIHLELTTNSPTRARVNERRILYNSKDIKHCFASGREDLSRYKFPKTWVLGSASLLSWIAISILAPESLSDEKSFILAICAASFAGLFALFVSGEIVKAYSLHPTRSRNLVIQTASGVVLFVTVLAWWLSPLVQNTVSNVPAKTASNIIKVENFLGHEREATGRNIEPAYQQKVPVSFRKIDIKKECVEDRVKVITACRDFSDPLHSKEYITCISYLKTMPCNRVQKWRYE